MMATGAPPKVFVSYSWSTADHQDWVLGLATELTESGVDVILDKWHLRDGHDSIKFMESMVTDPEVKKVIILADKIYVERANARTGGVGTETQILTPDLYGGQDPDKFVLVVCERDEEGKPYIPTYYKGRIFIDMSDRSQQAASQEQLLRWIFGKPVHVRPAIGRRPDYLEKEPSIDLGTGAAARRCLDAISHGKPIALGALISYFEVFQENLERFRIVRSNEMAFDDQVVRSIDDFLHFRNEVIAIFKAVAQYAPAGDFAGAIHHFFEALLEYTARAPEHAGRYHETDWDNYRFFVHELFLYAIAALVRFERFEVASTLLTKQYLLPKSVRESRNDPTGSFDRLFNSLGSFEERKRRTASNRISLWADKLIERVVGSGLEMRELCQADMLAYVKGQLAELRWYPVTWIYLGESSGTLELFARGSSARYFQEILVPLLGIDDKAAFVDAVGKMRRFQAGYSTMDLDSMFGLDKLSTRP
ncbi:hypothetical protein ABIC94_002596 [Variovorax paradoxus]|uniref:SEFIR domain-containing protein n=1 Tax=Variovorax paradoxus TaxID=34073 RepID=UPI0033916C47